MRLLLALLLLLGMSNPVQAQVIRIWGPAAMEAAAQRWVDHYRASHPDVRFELTMKGSDSAMPGLYTGKADIALMGRENDITDDNGFGRVRGYPPTRIELMRGSLASPGHSPALVVLVAADSPLRQITMAELRALFGGEGAAARLHMPDARSGTGRFFTRAVLGGSNKLNWPVITEYPMRGGAGWTAIAAALRADRSAIGIGTLADMAGLRALPIMPETGGQAIPATADTVRLGTYPLARHAYAFVDLKPGTALAPHVAAFLRYAMSPAGQAELVAGDWLPVDEATITRNLAALSLPLGDPTPMARQVASGQAAYRPAAPVSGTIGIWGHGSYKRDFMGRLVRRWFGEFQRFHPDTRLDYRMYGTASAIGALATGAGNLALLGEEISPEQLESFRRARGYDPTMIEVANGSLQTNFFDYAHMIFVNKDNPLSRLTLGQLEGVFGTERRCGGSAAPIRTWGELGLGGEWAGRPIAPHMWKTDTDFAQLLRERALCGSHRWNPALHEVLVGNRADGTPYDLGQHLLDDLAADRYGVAASNIRFPQPDVKPVALAWTGKGPFVQASDATLIDRTYPLGRVIPAYIDRKPGAKTEPVMREFLRYLLSREGQTALIEESGYLPLSAQTAAQQRAKLP